MKVSVIAIGDEILLGRITDTNSGYIARAIDPMGWRVNRVSVVRDDAEEIRGAVERELNEADVVITTGGLGPTKDDITKSTLAAIFGGAMRVDEDILRNVEEVMQRRGRALNELTKTQAIVPDSCRVIQNRVGTAPIMWFERDEKVLVSMPGVPFEMEQMFSEEVLPQLLSRFATDVTIAHRSLIIAGISESALAESIADIEDSLPPHLHIAYLPKQHWIHLRIDAMASDAELVNTDIERLHKQLCERLEKYLLYDEDLPLAAILLRLLDKRGLTCATAESCTGGNIAHEITLIPGSSSAMLGGIVSYSNDVKEALLGVDAQTLRTHGAVSIPVVEQMAKGAARSTGASLAMATSGIAGPGGAPPGKPVGTVCIAVAMGDEVVSDTFHFPGNRARVIAQATNTALIMAIRRLK